MNDDSATRTVTYALNPSRIQNSIGDNEILAQLAAALAPTYEIGVKLGSGGFGSVYRAVHVNTGQGVAVKVLRLQSGWSPQAVAAQIARFEREATLCAALRHPNIVRLLDKGHTQTDNYYAIYELVAGETLRDLLARERQISVERTAEIMSQVLDALATAHAAGVVHRDLKPANIMVVNTGLTVHVKVLDFGISTLTLEARDAAFNAVTRSHELVGTPQYCAPEQLRGDLPTPRTDLYAWGLVFLECITGRRAVSGTTLAEVYHQHLSSSEISIPSSIVDHPLGAFLRRVLRKNPADRAADAAQLHTEFQLLPLGDLVGIVGEGPVTAGRESTDARVLSAAEFRIERRQVSVIAFNLRLVPVGEQPEDLEALDPILRDQLGVCRDALIRYGGTITGELGDTEVAMFGYPTASDADARRAVRTVLELSEDVRKRSRRLTTTHGLGLQFRIGIHTGPVTVFEGHAPAGLTPTRALALSAAAAPNTILVSPESRRLFEPFVELEAGALVTVNGEVRPIQTSQIVGERRGDMLSLKAGPAAAHAFIGRQAALGQLEEHLARAHGDGPICLAMVVGEAGIGKSRLVREFLRGARVGGRPVLECRCLAEQRNVALSPVLPVLRSQLGLRDVAPAAAGDLLVEALRAHGLDLARFVPILCLWLSIPLPDGFEAAQMAPFRQRALLLEALVVILARPLERRGPILLFEDLHWADPTTIELLGLLLEAENDPPPFLVCTARPEFETPWKQARVANVNLDRLTPSEAECLVLQTWGGSAKPSPEVVAAIVGRTDGIPLFVEELTRMVAGKGSGQVELKAIPITLRDSLAGRLDQLGESRAVAQLAAVLGREFDGEILLAVANGDEFTVNHAIERLTEARLIYRRRRVLGSTYVFRHVLIQQAAYDSMPRAVRRSSHSRVVDVLEHQFPDSSHSGPAELARHHAGAGQYEAAVRRGTEAAAISIEKSSNQEAIALVGQVREWLSELPEPMRADAELRLNGIKLQALMSTQGWASADVRALAEQSRALLGQSRTMEHTVSILFCLLMHYHVASERAACRRVADELVEFADRIEDPSTQSVSATAKGVHFYAEGRFLEAETWLEKARGLYDPARHQNQGSIFGMDCRVWATAQQALVQWAIGRTGRALQLANEAIEWAREIKHVPSLGIALLYISQIHQMDGDKASVRLRIGELLEVSKTFGLPAFEGYGATLACWAEGDLQGVEAIIRALKSLNCNLILTYYGSFLADIEADAGRFPHAIAQVDNGLAMCAAFNEHVFEAELLRRRGLYEMCLDNPDLEVVRQSLDRAAQLARQGGAFRFEAAAIRDAVKLFGENEERRDRLAQICGAVPDLITATAPAVGAQTLTIKAKY